MSDLTVSHADALMLSLRVVRKQAIAQGIHLYELALATGEALPVFTAGSHVTVLTPNQMTRRYSLCNAPSDRARYVIAVQREPNGLGGSASMVDQVQVGDVLEVSRPLNYFPLDGQATKHLLIAGGIGITPIMAMVRELQERQADFRLVYATRSPQATAFLAELSQPDLSPRVLIHHDHGDRALSLDLAAVVSDLADGEHVYCCGPRGFMNAVRDLARHRPAHSVHFEDFGSGEPAPTLEDRAFTVRLLRSQRTVAVPAGVSILYALRGQGISVPSSCESGTCGTCRTGLRAGVAQHRDYVLDEEEQANEIMICVSRAESEVLDLDL